MHKKPTSLTNSELDEVLVRVAPAGIEYGAARICRLLASGPALTRVVNQKCSVGNISDLVNKSINPVVEDLGLYVACDKPAYRILNKFNQPSGQMVWAFFRDVESANDEHFELVPDYILTM